MSIRLRKRVVKVGQLELRGISTKKGTFFGTVVDPENQVVIQFTGGPVDTDICPTLVLPGRLVRTFGGRIRYTYGKFGIDLSARIRSPSEVGALMAEIMVSMLRYVTATYRQEIYAKFYDSTNVELVFKEVLNYAREMFPMHYRTRDFLLATVRDI